MCYFASLPADVGVRYILALNPAAGQALVMFHSAALRNDVPLTPKDKELICLFNFMNRLLEGHVVKGGQDVFTTRGQALFEHGYDPLLSHLRGDR